MNAHATRSIGPTIPGSGIGAVLMALPAAVVVPGIVLLALVARLLGGWGTPLWFDETFSAVIASQPDVASLIDWCRSEIGGPIYYVALWGWAQVFGTSAVALRSMSFVASILACLVILWRGHPDRRMRLWWAGLMALWMPGIDPATNARCYALLLLACAVQAIAYRRLMEAPTRARALAWTTASVVAILCHSYVALIALVGGLIFLGVHRMRALACWPALAPLVPLAAWMTFQLPVMLAYGGQGIWYPTFGLLDLALAPGEFFGSLVIELVLVVGLVAGFVKGWRGDHAVADRAVAASGLIALAVLLAVAMVHPSFTWRYVIPFGPTILFALLLWVRTAERHVPAVPAIMLTLFAATALGQAGYYAAHQGSGYRESFNLQRPSAWLAQARPRHLAFLWDSPVGTMSDPRRMDEVSGYFLRGDGVRTDVTVLHASPTLPTATVVTRALAANGAIDSIIWIADELVPGTRGMPKPSVLTRIGWSCRDFGLYPIHVLTCRAAAASTHG